MSKRAFNLRLLCILLALLLAVLLSFLVFSGAEADFSVPDSQHFTAGLSTENIPLAQLGTQALSSPIEESKLPVSERYPWLLPVAVALATVVVAFLLLRVIRQARKVLPPPSSEARLDEEAKREEIAVVNSPPSPTAKVEEGGTGEEPVVAISPPPVQEVKLGEERKRGEMPTVHPPPAKEPIVRGEWKNYDLIDTAPYAIGGFADIFRARDKRTGEIVAIKTPRIAKEGDIFQTLDRRVLDEFLGEAERWSRLKHQNIIELKDFGSRPLPWLAMEFAEQGNLRKRLSLKGSLSVAEMLKIAFKLCDALHYTHHHGVVHLDIKPENILFIGNEPKLTDWGTAKTLLYEKVTRSKFTPEYAAPEQLNPDYGEPDWRTDIYQLGVVAYEMLSGKAPFTSESPALLMKQILEEPPKELSEANPRLNTVILKCLKKRKEGRYEVIWLLKEDLERLKNV